MAVAAGKFCVATHFRSDHDKLDFGDEHRGNDQLSESGNVPASRSQPVLPAAISVMNRGACHEHSIKKFNHGLTRMDTD